MDLEIRSVIKDKQQRKCDDECCAKRNRACHIKEFNEVIFLNLIFFKKLVSNSITVMVNYCCVAKCKSTEKLGDILHRVPTDKNRQKPFADAIQKHDWNPTNSRICEVRIHDL